MRKFFQITFCLLACACVIAAVPLGAFCGLDWCLVALLAAAVFAALMTLAKSAFRKRELRPDFMNSAEENEAIRKNAERNDDES